MIDFTGIKGVILDMDGVLWRGKQLLPGFDDLFSFLQARQIPYVFATNNSTRRPVDYVAKLERAGLRVDTERILTSSTVAAIYLRDHFPEASTAFVVGEDGLHHALTEAGFQLTTEQADLLVVGLDRQVNYDKLRAAAYQLQGGAIFIGTNGDVSFPEAEGLAPGAGSVLAAIEAATGVAPKIMGKPELPIFEAALKLLDVPAGAAVMVGDRLETDILGANQAGLQSALLLTGVSTEADVERTGIKPDGLYADLPTLLAAWS